MRRYGLSRRRVDGRSRWRMLRLFSRHPERFPPGTTFTEHRRAYDRLTLTMLPSADTRIGAFVRWAEQSMGYMGGGG